MDELFTPLQIGRQTIKNRIVMASAERRAAETCSDPGSNAGVHPGLIAMYAARAKGGVGLVILEDTDVDSRTGSIDGHETSSPAHPCLDRDLFIPAFKELTDTIHAFGAKIIPNLRHLGRIAIPSGGARPLTASAGRNPIGPSRYGHMMGPNAKAATLAEIEFLESKFEEAAFRAKRAGFDGVQIAGHHGFVIAQFLSSLTNHRKDDYGGSLTNRMRFAVEIVQRIRARIGPEMMIVFALSGTELVEGGQDIDEGVVIARTLQDAGVDAIHVVPGLIFPFPNGHRAMPTMGEPHATFVEMAHEIKKFVDIPVIANGRIKEPALAAEIVAQGKADMISMTRSLISEPDWANKVLRGELETIRPCIGCNYCVDALQAKLSARCTVNAGWGKESEALDQVVSPKTVVIVGGGPAGLEAGRTAALRGHTVHIIEKSDRLGGQLRLAHLPPGKQEIEPFLDYLVGQVSSLPISVQLGLSPTTSSVQQMSPDVVIIATGATPAPRPKLLNATVPVLSAWDVLEQGVEAVGERVIVAGGGATGCEVAELMAHHGKTVTVLEMETELARDMNPLGEGMRHFLLERMERLDVQVLLGTRFVDVEGAEVVVADADGKSRLLPADTVVMSIGVRPNDELDEIALRRVAAEVYRIGDCLKPRNLLDAVWEGSLVGMAT